PSPPSVRRLIGGFLVVGGVQGLAGHRVDLALVHLPPPPLGRLPGHQAAVFEGHDEHRPLGDLGSWVTIQVTNSPAFPSDCNQISLENKGFHARHLDSGSSSLGSNPRSPVSQETISQRLTV